MVLIAFFLALLAASALCSPISLSTEGSPLIVELSATDKNAVIEAAVSNVGSSDLSVLKTGSILDTSETPIKKVSVFKDDKEVAFHGVFVHYDLDHLSSDSFTTIKAGETIKTTIDLAPVFDLSSGSSFTVATSGLFQFTEVSDHQTRSTGSNIGFAPFESDALELTVDPVAAAKVEKIVKRITIDECTATEATTLENAFSLIVPRAAEAATAALTGTADRMEEYFKASDSETRSEVADRYNAISSNAETTNSGFATYFCEDFYGFCEVMALSYTLSTDNSMVNCPLYYSYLQETITSCHSQDQWSVSLHEMTHVPDIYSPYTNDYTYGYAASTALPRNLSLLNADNYALFAKAVFLDC